MNNNDQTLGDTAPDTAPPAGGAFGDPNGPATPQAPVVVKQWTLAEVLDAAELPEKHARICVKANLQAEHDQIVAELMTLVDTRGEVIEDEEAAAGEATNDSRAIELNDRLRRVSKEMAGSMWFPLFRGLCVDDLAVFNKQHIPKGDSPDLTEYNIRLVAECSVEPWTVDDVKALRKKFGSAAMQELISTAHEVCVRGGVDVPKSPVSLRNLTQR